MKPETTIHEERMTEAKNTEIEKATNTPRQDRSYQPRVLEEKWQAKWEADKLYRAVIDERG